MAGSFTRAGASGRPGSAPGTMSSPRTTNVPLTSTRSCSTLAGRRPAEAALADGDREAAAERLHRAAPLADRLGARPLSDEIASLARRARIALAAGTAEPGRLGLTDREFEVLRLVAAGRSNRQIAAELFISVKTASVHVSNILAKLGVGSRGEAAARAHDSHLFDTP